MRAVAAWLVVLIFPLSTWAQLTPTQDDPNRVRSDLQSLAGALRDNPRVDVVLQALPAISAALRDKDAASDALPVIEQAVAVLLPSAAEAGTWQVVAPLLKFAARTQFDQADPARAETHLKALREMYRIVSVQNNISGGKSQWAKWLNEVAAEYLRGDQIGEALALLGEVADLDLPLGENLDDGRASVAGALNRRLQGLTADERYELLHEWTMPTETRRTVRVLSSLTSVEAPPSVFARALGERPRATAFPLLEIGGVPGLFSTAWILVSAAADSGQLRRLTSELNELTRQNVPHAEFVRTLARIADERDGRDQQFVANLHAQATRLRESGAAPTEQAAWSIRLDDVVIAAASMGEDMLRPAGEEILQAALELTYGRQSMLLRPFLRRAAAAAVQKRFDAPDLIGDPNLELWIPASSGNAASAARGAVREVWLAYQDQILHLAGPGMDYLCFRYPLSGDFEFQCEAQDGGAGGTEGNVAFGGLAYETYGTSGLFSVWNVDMGQSFQRPCPFIRRAPWATFQRLSLKSSGDDVRFSINGHPIFTDPVPHSTSPWVGLRSFSGRVPVFRGLAITGSPVIPREVRMSDGNLLRGWFSRYYPGTVSTEPLVVEQYVPETGLDWFLKDGVIHGARNGRDLTTATQSRLSYFRPLQNGESISYEFLYEPGRYEVHPALGRLAFVIEPTGVELHWMTTEESEWTGLADDNSVIEPLNRRGPRAVPLKVGEWNRIAISLAGDTATLTLNDIPIYSRKLEPDNPRTFSLYHDRNQSAVRVRNVVMRGDWPERLTEEQLANLATPRQPDQTVADRQALGAVFAERHIPDSALDVHRRAAAMPPERCYDFLANWVLPGPDHDTLRLALDFTPTHPSPPVVDDDPLDTRRLEIAASRKQTSVPTGGNLVAPALDLIEVARQLGRLDQVRQQVDRIATPDDYTRRSRLSMLALVDIAREDFPPAIDALLQLFALVEAGSHTQFSERWPETLALYGALRQPPTREAARELAVHLYFRQVQSGADSGSEAWRRQVLALGGLAKHFELKSGAAAIEHFTSPPELHQWRPVSRTTARSRGLGFPRYHLQLIDGRVDSFACHDVDSLYFRSPLRGNYEIECDVPAFGWRDTQLSVAGIWVGASYDLKSYTHGNFRRVRGRNAIDPSLTKNGRTLHYRVVVRDGASTTFVNGRRIHDEPLLDHHEPWLAIRFNNNVDSSAENVRITGDPEIPAELRLSATDDLEGWISYYDNQTVGGPQPNWQQLGDLADGGGILGTRRPDVAGTFLESLFRYHRPMLEDGTIEYEFYYSQGESHCHPALDRLAFLLEPAGVRIHWITDGIYDRTQLAADNVADEPDCRRGGGPLPLHPDAWNRLAVTLQGDTIRIALNGLLIYQRTLELTNLRTFGLFHYVDQTEARVRNVTWRGDWPRELPPVTEQELRGEGADFLDKRLPELTAVFQHDFSKDGFPLNLFSIAEGDQYENFSAQADGLHVNRTGIVGYRNATLAPRLSIRGDFDITAMYDLFQAELSDGGAGTLILQTRLENAAADECMVYRRANPRSTPGNNHFFQTATVRVEGSETRRSYSASEAFEASSGALRLARRGDMVYFLLAEGDSPNFRIVRTEKVAADDVRVDGLRLFCQIKESGRIDVVWKSLNVRAEGLSGLALENTEQIVAELDRQRNALPTRFVHDFSRDELSEARMYRWGIAPPRNPTPGGLLVSGRPADAWASSGVVPHVGLRGDFDISFEFDVLTMDVPKPGLNSAVYLQIELPVESKQQCSVILSRRDNGQTHTLAQLRLMNPDGTLTYPSLRQEVVSKIRQMRIARRDGRLFFLYSVDPSKPDRLLARFDASNVDIPDGFIRMLVHTGGAGRVTEAAFKKFTVHAREVIGAPATLQSSSR